MNNRMLVARMHATTREFRRKLAASERLVARWVEECDHRVAVEFSGGKDSTVVLDMVRRVVPNAPALHGDDEWLLPETNALLSATAGLVRLIRPLLHTDWFTAWAEVEGPNGGSKHRWAIEHGVRGVASGLRADENPDRRKHIAARGDLFMLTNGLRRCYPIARWSWRDVWAYIVSREVQYNRAYDVLERIGVPPEHQRVGPLATERALDHQITQLKRGWPTLYKRFVARYPEATQYV